MLYCCPAQISFGSTILAETNTLLLEEFQPPQQSHENEIASFVRGKNIKGFDRGNVSHSFSFSPVLQETEYEEAYAKACERLEQISLTTEATLTIIIGAKVITIEDSVLDSAEPTIGTDLTRSDRWAVTYTFTGGKITVT